LRRQLRNTQNAGQHRFELQESQVIQAREPYIAGQQHPQNEPELRHRARLPLHRQGFLNQLLESELLQHRGHR